MRTARSVKQGILGPKGQKEIKGKDYEKHGKHAIEAVAIKQQQIGPLAGEIRPQKLRSNQVPAKNEKEVDAHPTQAHDGKQNVG